MQRVIVIFFLALASVFVASCANNERELFIAAQNDDVHRLNKLLESGVNPNVSDGYGYTPLFGAARYGYVENVEALLKAGATPYAYTQGYNILTVAILKGHTEVVRALVKAVVYLHRFGPSNKSPLMLAAEGGHTEMVEIFLKAGTDLFERSSALTLAVEGAHTETVRVLLGTYADSNELGTSHIEDTVLTLAVRYAEIAKLLLGSDPVSNACDRSGKTASTKDLSGCNLKIATLLEAKLK